MHRFATNTLAATVIAGVLIGGYTFFGPTLRTPAAMEVTAQAAESVGEPGPAVAVPGPPLRCPMQRVRVVHPTRERSDELATRSENAAATVEPDATGVVAAPAGAPDLPPAIMPGPTFLPSTADAKTYRERGMFAYRDGDLIRALADFNRAIEQDPNFAAAYIDRGIVFYRMRKFDRAFADMAQAKRLTRPEREEIGRSPHAASAGADQDRLRTGSALAHDCGHHAVRRCPVVGLLLRLFRARRAFHGRQ